MNQGTLARWLAVLFIACLLVAGCNSDSAFVEPDPGTDPDTGDPDEPEDPVELVSTIVLLADQPVLLSDAIDDEDGVTITAIARDENNNVVSGAELNFSADSGALNVLDPTTTESGRSDAVLTTGGDTRNRTITVEVSGGEAEASITVEVLGTQLTVSGPASIESLQTETYTLSLLDAGGDGIRDVTIEANSENGNTISPASVTTDVDGTATVEVTGSVGGQDTLTFEGLDLTATQQILVSAFGIRFETPDAGVEVDLGDPVDIEVVLTEDGNPIANQTITFSTTRGTLDSLEETTDANGRASVTHTSNPATNGAGPVLVTARGPENVARTLAFELVATTPDAITIQAEPSTIAPEGEAAITAVVRDSNNNPVKNQDVRFSLNDASGGSLTSSTDVTDSQGVARTTYRASSASSSTEGVEITAEVGNPAIDQDSASITVAAPTLFIVLGTDNQIDKNDEAVTYDKNYTALITDSAGNPAPPDTTFRLSLRSLEYQKGQMLFDANDEVWFPDFRIDDTDPHFGTPNPNPPPDFGPYFGQGPFGCRSEDPQGTGNINQSDDYNGNGIIDPPNAAEVPSTVEVDEDGFATFTIRWPQSYAFWVLVRLTATATVSGTENVRQLDFVLPIASDDLSGEGDPPNRFSPFGDEDECANPL